MDDEFLAFFAAQCCGIKLYAERDDVAQLDFGLPVAFRRNLSNQHDTNCVEVYVRPAGWLAQPSPRADSIGCKLGHVDRASARWLSALLLGPFRITG